MDEPISLDSDSDFEPPSAKRSKRGRRKATRGQKKTPARGRGSRTPARGRGSRTLTRGRGSRTPTRGSRTPTRGSRQKRGEDTSTVLCIDSDDDIPHSMRHETNQNCDIDEHSRGSEVAPSITVPSVSRIEGDDVPLEHEPMSSPQKDSNTNANTNAQAVPIQARKTTRRGLARKTESDSVTVTRTDMFSLSATRKKASVYSECVGHGFESIFGTGSATSETPCDSDKVLLKSTEENADPESRLQGPSKSETAASATSSEDGALSDVVMEEADGDKSIQDALREPTPPPELKKIKNHRMSRRVTNALKSLSKANAANNRAQRTLSWKQRQQLIRESPDILHVDSPVRARHNMIIKVRYLSTVHRLRHNLTQPFHLLLSSLSKEIGQEEHRLKLFLHDSSISLSSTPKDVNLTVADIIECYSMTDTDIDATTEESISVVIQCSKSKKKTTVVANQRLPLQDLMKRYADRLNLDASSFTFCFDGDYVNPKDTPLTLDLEDGDILDVVPKGDGSQLAHAHNCQVITLS